MRLSLQETRAPVVAWVQVCESTTVAPVWRPVGAVVTVPVIISLIVPRVAAVLGVIVLPVIVVSVIPKEPPSVEGTVRTQVPDAETGPTATLTVVGTKVTVELTAIPKFPDDAELVPGLTIVFDVVAAVMSAAGARVATPPLPGVNTTLPLVCTAYA
jgi:hypothetical protein